MRIASSVPEVHALVAQSWYPRRLYRLDRINPAQGKRCNQHNYLNWQIIRRSIVNIKAVDVVIQKPFKLKLPVTDPSGLQILKTCFWL
jgi:hypothetical protein